MTKKRWPIGQLVVRQVRLEDIGPLTKFSCSLGEPWEEDVEDEIRANLALRYIGARDGEHDARMLVALGPATEILAIAAHRVEPVVAALPNTDIVDLRPTYLEVRPSRDSLIFGRVDRRHEVSLAFCDRVGLTTQRANQDPQYVQRWGDV